MIKTKYSLENLLKPASTNPSWTDKPAIIMAGMDQSEGGTPKMSERIVTYGELEKLIDSAQAKLIAAGVKARDRVVLTSPNSPEIAAAVFAAWRLGACAVPCDFRMTTQEVGNVAARIGAKALCFSTKFIAEPEKAFAALKEKGAQLVDVKNLSAESAKAGDIHADESAPALVILTSGTTGVPKGAVHDLGTLLVNFAELGEMGQIKPDTVAVLPLPLSHIFGLEVFSIVLLYGASVVFTDLAPQTFVGAIKRYRPTVLVGVPTIYTSLLGLPDGVIDLSRAEILLCGGAPLPLSLAEDFKAKYGKRINNGYGSTETKIIALNLDGPYESVGKIAPSVKIEIIADEKILPEGETGELRIVGPILMQGYLDQPELTEKVLHHGHYHTGDLGYIKDGYVYISGRAKEMIIVAGNKVFPTEVEDVLRKHNLVQEVAVVGMPHSKLGQIVKAVIVISDKDVSLELGQEGEAGKEARQKVLADLKEYCKQNLKRELRPMEWDLRPNSQPLPKTNTGKVDKKQLGG